MLKIIQKVFVVLTILKCLLAYRFGNRFITNSLRLSTNNDIDAYTFRDLPTILTSESQMAAFKFLHVMDRCNQRIEEVGIKTVAQEANITEDYLLKLIQKSMNTQKVLVKSNLRLVQSIAFQHINLGLDLNDLVYEGIKGLQLALNRYDVNKGYQFSTYAYPYIKESIRIALAKSTPISVPRHIHRLLMKVKGIENKLYFVLGREPTEDELIQKLNITPEKFDIIRRAIAFTTRSSGDTTSVSEVTNSNNQVPTVFDETTWEQKPITGTEGSIIEYLESSEQLPSESIFESDTRFAILSALKTLPIDEAMVIYMKLGLSDLSQLNTTATDPKFDITKLQSLISKNTTNAKDNSIANVEHNIKTNNTVDNSAINTLYHKGMKRLRRQIASRTYNNPQLDALDDNISTTSL